MTTQLSPHFSLLEATHSNTAVIRNIDNTPPADILANMTAAAQQLEAVRSYLAQPMNVDSWYRCPELNAAVGGVGHSSHMDGWAIDFVCPAFGSPEDIVKFLISTGIKFDQLIMENSWVHCSFAPTMRQQVLEAHFVPGQNTTYTNGA
jgi:hypothetical protein